MKVLAALVFTPLVAAVAAAQEPQVSASPPPDAAALEQRGVSPRIAAHAARVFRDPAATRWEGDRRVEPGDTVAGDVAAHGGLVVIGGRITGELVVVDGDVEFLPGGSVDGDVTIIDGMVRGVEAGSVGGTLTVYGRAMHRDEADWERERRRRVAASPRVRVGDGGARLVLRVGPNYNRVEGLPVSLGPQIETGGSNPLRVEALAILRTEGDRPLDGERVGYSVRAEQFLGGRREVRLGFGVRSVVSPIETWQLSDLEASLATLLLHSDQRDYFERTGWGAYARFTPRHLPLDVTLEYRDEDHGVAAAGDPWTLFGDDPWRPQPLVAEGRLRSLVGEATLDLRDGGEDEPQSGWYASAVVNRGLGGDLRLPESFVTIGGDEIGTIPPQPVDEGFTTALLDLRRYNRVGRFASLDFRVVLGGSITESALPPQFQHALGGPGSLPGYALLGADCGARQTRVDVEPIGPTPTFFYRYGCDRIALFQAVYRGGLSFDLSWGDGDDVDDVDDDGDEDWDWDSDWDVVWGWDWDLTWSLFFDAARGWVFGDSSAFARTDTGALYDVGAGIVFGDDLGIYAAVPLEGRDHDVRVFLRLGRRF
ncbi:MAG TPA: polymer-forming cytoskeletal protein [Longimicrobiales bacterium]